MRTRDLKALAEEMEDEYEEYWEQCIMNNEDPMDIFSWVGMQQMTAEEEMNDYKRDEGIIGE